MKHKWPAFGPSYNLENFSDKELDAFWPEFQRPGKEHLKMLWPNGDVPSGAKTALSAMSSFALNLRVARKAGTAGDTKAAQTYLRHAELAYDRLPKWAKW